MADTVEQIVRRLRGLCPLAPPLVALEWVQEAYNRISDNRAWSHLRGEGQITVAVQKTGTCAVTRGSATVTRATLVFAAGDAGRQFKLGTMQPATILSVNVAGNTAVLDQPFPNASAAAGTGVILDAFVTMPEDFGRFVSIIDMANQRQLRIYITDEEVNFYDPSRVITGQARAVVSRRLSSFPATLGQIQYELYPYQTAAVTYPYYYIKRPAALAFTDSLSGVFRHRPDVLLKGALLECCKWPGVGVGADKLNPYSRLSGDRLELMVKEYELMLAQLETKDEDVYMTWLETIGVDKYPFHSMPFQSADFRSTDV